uniref:Uncharacterized protein n=1 Tax=Scophthalmus maximus TaxID=52904 RepID=A0A8D3B7D6_SCOMX
MQSRLQELSRINVKVTCSDQASQTVKTEEAEGVNDYKSLFEKAKEKVDELIKDKEASLAAAKRDPSPGQGDEGDIDEIALQVDSLMRELDQRNKERDELRSQVSSFNLTKTLMATQRKKDVSLNFPSIFLPPSLSLIKLQQNIGRLLVTHVPPLDPDKVNYECDVIDEILEKLCLRWGRGITKTSHPLVALHL